MLRPVPLIILLCNSLRDRTLTKFCNGVRLKRFRETTRHLTEMIHNSKASVDCGQRLMKPADIPVDDRLHGGRSSHGRGGGSAPGLGPAASPGGGAGGRSIPPMASTTGLLGLPGGSVLERPAPGHVTYRLLMPPATQYRDASVCRGDS